MSRFELYEIVTCKFCPDYPEIVGKDMEIQAITTRHTGRGKVKLYSCKVDNKVYVLLDGNIRKKKSAPVLSEWEAVGWIPEGLKNE